MCVQWEIRKDLGKTDPEVLDELEEVEAQLYQQDTGISIYVSSSRFDIQFCVKKLSEIMTKPTKAGQSWTGRASEMSRGTQKLTLIFDHQEYSDIVKIPRGLRLGWKRRTLLHPCRT